MRDNERAAGPVVPAPSSSPCCSRSWPPAGAANLARNPQPALVADGVPHRCRSATGHCTVRRPIRHALADLDALTLPERRDAGRLGRPVALRLAARRVVRRRGPLLGRPVRRGRPRARLPEPGQAPDRPLGSPLRRDAASRSATVANRQLDGSGWVPWATWFCRDRRRTVLGRWCGESADQIVAELGRTACRRPSPDYWERAGVRGHARHRRPAADRPARRDPDRHRAGSLAEADRWQAALTSCPRQPIGASDRTIPGPRSTRRASWNQGSTRSASAAAPTRSSPSSARRSPRPGPQCTKAIDRARPY